MTAYAIIPVDGTIREGADFAPASLFDHGNEKNAAREFHVVSEQLFDPEKSVEQCEYAFLQEPDQAIGEYWQMTDEAADALPPSGDDRINEGLGLERVAVIEAIRACGFRAGYIRKS